MVPDLYQWVALRHVNQTPWCLFPVGSRPRKAHASVIRKTEQRGDRKPEDPLRVSWTTSPDSTTRRRVPGGNKGNRKKRRNLAVPVVVAQTNLIRLSGEESEWER